MGTLTRDTKIIMRGSDGGSENVSYTMHGVHVNVVRTTRKELIWARLPPDHSHDYCDRWFSALEGWLTDPSASKCNTLHELISLIARKRPTSAYNTMKLQLFVLLWNFDFDRWLEGCTNASSMTGIKTPLVWRYVWDDVAKTVRVFFKHNMADAGSFMRDEWGPWHHQYTDYCNPESGVTERVQVKRTIPTGVPIELNVPDIEFDPGIEPWIPDCDSGSESVCLVTSPVGHFGRMPISTKHHGTV